MLLERHPAVFNTAVHWKQPLPVNETVLLEFFGDVVAAVPELSEYTREDMGFEEAAEESQDSYRLVQPGTLRNARQLSVDRRGIVLAVAPPLGIAEADRTARIVYPLISKHLRPNPLLIDCLDVSFRFGFPYKGNHDQFILGKLFGNTAFADLVKNVNGSVIDFQPTLVMSISGDHSTRAVVEIQTATSMREIESQVYDGDEIMVMCGVAKIRGLVGRSLDEVYASLFQDAKSFVEEGVLKAIVQRLEEALVASASK